MQLESGFRTEQTNRTEKVDIDTKTIEARMTKENIEQLLKDMNQVDNQRSTNIKQITSAEYQFSQNGSKLFD